MTPWSEIMLTVHLGLNVSSSAHNCGYMVDGGNTMAANLSIIIHDYHVHVIMSNSVLQNLILSAYDSELHSEMYRQITVISLFSVVEIFSDGTR